ncbi:MAG TPA: NAD-dependent epimerase [Gordonia polyisoprenivorans]|uniref:NAD(P)-dependent oxidoreductase n=1 Tax=Gordonia polyisoprenivorans TaxID=84595 RepID=UPI00036F5FDC|nr:NAD(P)H-binding protein [Gordonia polyisoprenivorans]MBE7192106.1 NAD(P)H-binding protein [Gordonia polyisoprenivorans]OZC34276.1 NAD-dependent epimerase [Gordonia polyisoprenivorans]QUD83415.1 NAD(P)H-binding protein [Gordonia polyisoprenivorans]UZF55627.1 NAD(P)H-binding protein [Gordonia polyisoprenivorans]WCB36772.1 NAD(P)H-binding protein [Gordonia polyisoprenivorans]
MSSHIAIFGGTGYAGGHIAAEAVRRGHQVTSYSRSGAPADPVDGVTYDVGSLADADLVNRVAETADVVVIAVHGADVDGKPLVDLIPSVTAAALAHNTRVGVVGGAGSSLVAEGGPRLVDTPDFNDEWKPEALAHADVLDALRAGPEELDWFYVSPAALFGSWAPGETTGSYRTDDDLLVTKDDGSSEISGTDYALAFVDEIEQRAHVRKRFTTGH